MLQFATDDTPANDAPDPEITPLEIEILTLLLALSEPDPEEDP